MRDFQRQRIYDAQYRPEQDSPALRHRVESLSEAMRVASDVAESLESLGYPKALFYVEIANHLKRGSIAGNARAKDGRIRIEPRASRATIAHEVAHVYTWGWTSASLPGHGIEFAQTLIDAYLSVDSDCTLRASMEKHKVVYDYEQRAAYTRSKVRWAYKHDSIDGKLYVRAVPRAVRTEPNKTAITGPTTFDGEFIRPMTSSASMNNVMRIHLDDIAYFERMW